MRACISEASIVEMAKIGRPVLVGIQTVENLRKRFHAYRDTMLAADYSQSMVENALDQCWAQRALYVTDSNDEAQEVAAAALKRYRDHLLDARIKYNPGGVPPRDPSLAHAETNSHRRT